MYLENNNIHILISNWEKFQVSRYTYIVFQLQQNNIDYFTIFFIIDYFKIH